MEVKQFGNLTITNENNMDGVNGTCIFCKKADSDDLKYGPKYTFENITTHYFCMLLSPNLIQNANSPNEGLLGFLVKDILKEVRRGSRLTCSFCKGKGASLGCDVKKCSVKFHLPCGLQNGTLHQFFGNYKSFCALHRPVQEIPPKLLKNAKKGVVCVICYDNILPLVSEQTLWAPCCQKNAFFHRSCIQHLAISTGYLFRCPLCNNEAKFTEEMKNFGIFIPDQDAAWERVPSAYQDLLMRHDTCDSARCHCPSGSKTNVEGTKWELLLCKFCGSQGIHVGCGKLKKKPPEFICSVCSGNDHTTLKGNKKKQLL